MTSPATVRDRAYRRLAAVILELDVENLTRRLEAERSSSRAETDQQAELAIVCCEATVPS